MKTKEYKRSESNPGALVNVDASGLEAYKKQRENMRKIQKMDDRLNSLENNVEEIKNLLKQALGSK